MVVADLAQENGPLEGECGCGGGGKKEEEEEERRGRVLVVEGKTKEAGEAGKWRQEKAPMCPLPPPVW